MAVATSIAITNGAGQNIECSAVVEAMILVLLHADDAICAHKEGLVELHYVRGSAKVAGKLKSRLADQEHIRKEPQ